VNRNAQRKVLAGLNGGLRETPVPPQERSIGWGLITFYALHMPLALLIYRSPALATFHALVTFLVGLRWALMGFRSFAQVAYAGAYLVGAEVLWRMTGAQVFWEFGKYGCAALFIVAMLRSNVLKGPWMALLYFALLLPSAALTITAHSPSRAREELSLHMSGPFALWICAWFFSHLKLSRVQLQRLMLAVIGPILSVAFITFIAIRSSSNLTFSNNSNFVTSGGFGPNQVSNALGLGALLAFLFVLDKSSNLKLRVLMFGAMFFCGIQSALTFSRGGLYSAGGAAVLALLFLMRDRRSRVKVILVAAILFVTINFIVLPRLDSFTGGALSTRFQKTDPTGRDRIAYTELDVWKANPILGVGPGQGKIWTGAAAHTEFTRILAEHGTLGLFALLLILTAGAQNLKRVRDAKSKALVASVMCWSFLFMSNAGMRLAAPALAFGLSFATFLPDMKRTPLRLFRNYRDKIISGPVYNQPLVVISPSASGDPANL